MEANIITTLVLPVALAIIMLGLGLSLTLADFRRVVVYPRAVILGLVCQMLILPVVCFLIAKVFQLGPELAVGLMLLAASPGGPTANLFSHLAKGDVALNITLTAVNSLLALFAMPLIVGLAMTHFLGEGRTIPLLFDKIVQVFAIVLVPVAIGMTLRAKNPDLAAKLDKSVRLLSTVFLILVIGAAIAKEWTNLGGFFQQVGLAALTFNIASMVVGFAVPLLAGVERRQAVATSMEIGIHNGTLALAIAGPLVLNNSVMAIPPAIYSLIMFFTAAGFSWFMVRRV